MSHHFKAKFALYNQTTQTFFEGKELIINMDYVVRVNEYEIGPIKKAEGMGTIFLVSTTIDNGPYPLKVTSKYLEDFLNHTE